MKKYFGDNTMVALSTVMQIAILLIVILLGLNLTSQISESIKITHAGLGMLAGIFALMSTFLSFKLKLSASTKSAAFIAVVFTLLAGIGGKLTEINYASGLLLMKLSAAVALLSSVWLLTRLYRKSR